MTFSTKVARDPSFDIHNKCGTIHPLTFATPVSPPSLVGRTPKQRKNEDLLNCDKVKVRTQDCGKRQDKSHSRKENSSVGELKKRKHCLIFSIE
jgi:hypothetical protein